MCALPGFASVCLFDSSVLCTLRGKASFGLSSALHLFGSDEIHFDLTRVCKTAHSSEGSFKHICRTSIPDCGKMGPHDVPISSALTYLSLKTLSSPPLLISPQQVLKPQECLLHALQIRPLKPPSSLKPPPCDRALASCQGASDCKYCRRQLCS